MSNPRKQARREQKRKDGHFDGRFWQKKEAKPEQYLDEEEHIEEQYDEREREDFTIEESEHRL
jgi:hypothetical protein